MNRIESPEINPHLYSQYLTKEARTYKGVKMVYSMNDVGKIGQIHVKNETRPPIYTIHENKLKWIRYLNVRLETIKILEENTSSNILDNSHSSMFSDISLQGMETKEKINRWAYIKLKGFCTANETINKIKRHPTEWENIHLIRD